MSTVPAPKKIRVMLERLHSDPKGSGATTRIHVGSEHFTPGTTANDVCEAIHKQHSKPTEMGVWMLQMQVSDPENYKDDELEDGCFKTIKDSSYVLEQGKIYFAVHYSGACLTSVIK